MLVNADCRDLKTGRVTLLGLTEQKPTATATQKPRGEDLGLCVPGCSLWVVGEKCEASELMGCC